MQKSFLRILALAFCLILAALPLTACGSGDSADSKTSSQAEVTEAEKEAEPTLVGSWEYESGGYTYTFNEDGTGDYSAGDNKMEFTYTDKGKSVEILYTGNTAPSDFEYKINGDTLTIKDSFGDDVVYKRK